MRWPRALLAALALCTGCATSSLDPALATSACAQLPEAGSTLLRPGLASDASAPEPSSGYTPRRLVQAHTYMAVTANPVASRVGCEVLRQGGSAVDAAIAVQMVLGLVEPQSSGLGGGGFMLHYDATTRSVQSYDGRETAPAAATPDYLRYINATESVPPLPVAKGMAPLAAFHALRQSGRSVGTPGLVRMLALAHQDHGRLPWPALLAPAIQLATDGFSIGTRMGAAIAGSRAQLSADAQAAAYFLNPDGSPKAVGTVLRNPAYAATLNILAKAGADAFYTGSLAQGMVAKIQMAEGGSPPFAITPGLTTLSDLASYQAQRRAPVCTRYHGYWVCGMGPPSSGAITVASTLGMLERFDLRRHKPLALDALGGQPTVMGVHLVSEAQRLAYADRNQYVADPDFVSLPGGLPAMLLDPAYLHQRAGQIDTARSMGIARAGQFGTTPAGTSATDGHGTTHLSVVDRHGNVVAMTSSIEGSMGSFRMTDGFLLNNQLTDFAVQPTTADGPVANRVESRKRPRSAMAPTLVFASLADGSPGDFVMATGSSGGAPIIQHVVKTLIGVLDWGLDAQQAASLLNFGASNSVVTTLGAEHPDGVGPLASGLRAMGHQVRTNAQTSGVASIVRVQRKGLWVLEAGVDPRREGVALGDSYRP